jgi:hypothetical protein
LAVSFWEVLWLIFISFAFVAYLMVMFLILSDLFRDRDTSGLAKAAWVIGLVFLPLLTALVYLIARGGGMAQRAMHNAAVARQQQDAYVREVAGKTTPSDQIAQARALFDAGVISQSEYDALKTKALV